MDEYEQKAQEFLKKTNTKLSVKYLKNDFYFDEDKEPRDIYEVTLQRGERKFTFKFGQSLDKSGLRLFDKNGKRTRHKPFKVPEEIIKLEKDNKKKKIFYPPIRKWFEAEHFNLSRLTYKLGEEPTAYDILACLTKYEVGTFEGFCDSYGYDTDSRRAEKIYNAVVEEYKNVCMLWSEKEVEELREIQ